MVKSARTRAFRQGAAQINSDKHNCESPNFNCGKICISSKRQCWQHLKAETKSAQLLNNFFDLANLQHKAKGEIQIDNTDVKRRQIKGFRFAKRIREAAISLAIDAQEKALAKAESIQQKVALMASTTLKPENAQKHLDKKLRLTPDSIDLFLKDYVPAGQHNQYKKDMLLHFGLKSEADIAKAEKLSDQDYANFLDESLEAIIGIPGTEFKPIKNITIEQYAEFLEQNTSPWSAKNLNAQPGKDSKDTGRSPDNPARYIMPGMKVRRISDDEVDEAWNKLSTDVKDRLFPAGAGAPGRGKEDGGFDRTKDWANTENMRKGMLKALMEQIEVDGDGTARLGGAQWTDIATGMLDLDHLVPIAAGGMHGPMGDSGASGTKYDTRNWAWVPHYINRTNKGNSDLVETVADLKQRTTQASWTKIVNDALSTAQGKYDADVMREDMRYYASGSSLNNGAMSAKWAEALQGNVDQQKAVVEGLLQGLQDKYGHNLSAGAEAMMDRIFTDFGNANKGKSGTKVRAEMTKFIDALETMQDADLAMAIASAQYAIETIKREKSSTNVPVLGFKPGQTSPYHDMVFTGRAIERALFDGDGELQTPEQAVNGSPTSQNHIATIVNKTNMMSQWAKEADQPIGGLSPERISALADVWTNALAGKAKIDRVRKLLPTPKARAEAYIESTGADKGLLEIIDKANDKADFLAEIKRSRKYKNADQDELAKVYDDWSNYKTNTPIKPDVVGVFDSMSEQDKQDMAKLFSATKILPDSLDDLDVGNIELAYQDKFKTDDSAKAGDRSAESPKATRLRQQIVTKAEQELAQLNADVQTISNSVQPARVQQVLDDIIGIEKRLAKTKPGTPQRKSLNRILKQAKSQAKKLQASVSNTINADELGTLNKRQKELEDVISKYSD